MRKSGFLTALSLGAAAASSALLSVPVTATATTAIQPRTVLGGYDRYCSVHVRAYALKDPAELAFAVWSDDRTGSVTGNITAYVNGARYTIPFADITAPDERSRDVMPGPIVVKFDAPAKFESAYVSSLSGGDCAIHQPFVGKPMTTLGFTDETTVRALPDRTRDWPGFLALVAQTPVASASAPVAEEPLSCAKPDIPATTADYMAPLYPNGIRAFFSGDILIKLALGSDGKVLDKRMEMTSRDPAYDTAAAWSLIRSKFSPEIYRCAAVTTDYYFDVKFAADQGDEPLNPIRMATGGLQGQGAHF